MAKNENYEWNKYHTEGYDLVACSCGACHNANEYHKLVVKLDYQVRQEKYLKGKIAKLHKEIKELKK